MKKITYLFVTLFVSFSYSAGADVIESMTKAEITHPSDLMIEQISYENQIDTSESSSPKEEITQISLGFNYMCKLLKTTKIKCTRNEIPSQLSYKDSSDKNNLPDEDVLSDDQNTLTQIKLKKITKENKKEAIPLLLPNYIISIINREVMYIFLAEKFNLRGSFYQIALYGALTLPLLYKIDDVFKSAGKTIQFWPTGLKNEPNVIFICLAELLGQASSQLFYDVIAHNTLFLGPFLF